VCKLHLAIISQFSNQFISNVKLNCKVRVNSSYSTFANDTKLYLRCRPPTPSEPQPIIVVTPLWFLCSGRQKSCPEVADLNVSFECKLDSVDEYLRFFYEFQKVLRNPIILTNFKTESHELSNYVDY